MSTTLHIIVNPAAGQDDAVLARLNDAFHDSPIEWSVSVTHKFGDGARLARQAIEDGADIIGVYGGDGTIGDVVNGIYPSTVPLAVFSGGTGNSVAVQLDIPSDLAESARYIAEGNYRLMTTDLGRIGDRLFILRVDIGKTVDIEREQERRDKDRLGIFTYYAAVARTFTSENDLHFTFNLDGTTVERDAAAFVLMNVRRDDSVESDSVVLRDGRLEFFLLRTGVGEALKGITAWFELVETEDLFEVFSAQRLTIETPTGLTVLADGEDCGTTPVTIELVPKSIRLVVPA
jgi:YegS/Rv2252/BmrU family lipid kinase